MSYYLFAESAGLMTTLIIAIVAAIVVAFGIGLTRNAAHKRDAALEQVARRLGGKLQPSSLFDFPVLRVPHLGRTVTLTYTAGGENESTNTHLAIPWPSGRLRCEIFPEGPLSPLRKLIGMQDIEIGSPQFDRQFIITGNDETAIKALLTPDAQARVFDLIRRDSSTAFSTAGLYLQISGGTLKVTKASYIADSESVEWFIQLFLQFYEAANGAAPAGIEFLDRPQETEAVEPHCIVCGEILSRDLVSCRSCRTPHHRDCWQYFGGCATYACGGKQHLPAKGSGRASAP